MNAPSPAIAPADLWLQITAIPRPSRVADFPRLDPTSGKPIARVRFQVLTQEEQMASSAAAEAITRKTLKDVPKGDESRRGYDDVYNNAAAVEVLFRACKREDEADKPFFPTPEAIRRSLTMDEVSILFDFYLRTQAELGPIVSKLSVEEMDAWVAKLTEGGSAFPLDLLSSDALKTLALSLAFRVRSLQTDISSAGSPPDVNATASPSESSPIADGDAA